VTGGVMRDILDGDSRYEVVDEDRFVLWRGDEMKIRWMDKWMYV
jgi:hypothetical protein